MVGETRKVPSVTLSLHSEPYSPSGNLAADGFKKLLGAPSIDLIQTLVREAVQNSCDAALQDGNAEVHFRVRRLSPENLRILRERVLADLPRDAGAPALRQFLRSSNPRVLEICDFNTTGLGGPTRADVATKSSDPTDFVDFLRNVGSPRDTFHGGGTYGYGKTSLYVASQSATIIVDSQTTCGRKPVRRLIGARLGSAFEATDGKGLKRRYTGRHWWGIDKGNIVDPLEGSKAARLSSAIGFPERDERSRGTSIMILDPIFNGDEDEKAIAMIREALLWFFWPRLLASTDKRRRLKFRIFHEDVEQPIPAPEQFPPLNLFAQAMDSLRQDESTVTEIRSQRPKRVLGRVSIAKGLAAERVMRAGEGDSLFPRRSAMIAVMRPVELVVRYYEGTPYPDDALEWAGVFVASSDDDVEEAFAKSEPPAHDDWQPESIPNRLQATMVRVAIREIKNAANDVVNPAVVPISTSGGGPSLAAAAGLLGRGLVGQGREGAGPRPPREGKGGGVRRKHRVSSPAFRHLRQVDGKTIAIFTAIVETDGTRDNLLTLTPGLAMDGGTAPRDGDFAVPNVLAVRHAGHLLGDGEQIEIGKTSGRIDIEIEMPHDCAVVVGAQLEAAGASE